MLGCMARLPLALLLCLAWFRPAHALVLVDQSASDIMRQADLVVLGTVTAQRSVLVRGAVMTQTLVRVEETLKGRPARQVVVSQLGGRINGVEVDVPGDARLSVGERVVLATYGHPDGLRYLVGMALGVFHVTPGGARQHLDATLVRANGEVVSTPPRAFGLSTLRVLAKGGRP
jgi:hypothetical protein